MRRLALTLIAFLALAGSAFAASVQLPGMTCSLTAYTPVASGGVVSFQGGTSCGGTEYDAYKDLNVCAEYWDGGGWAIFPGGCTEVGSYANPNRFTEQAFLGPGRYRTEALAQDTWHNIGAGGEVDSSAVTVP